MNLQIISSVALGVALGLAFVIYSRFEDSASSDQDRELASRGQENAEQDSIGALAPYESNLPREDQHVRGATGELSSTSTTEKQLGFEMQGSGFIAPVHERSRLSFALDLFFVPGLLEVNSGGTRFTWQMFRRRCGPDWQCVD